MATKLKDLWYRAIALVGKGANQEAHVVIAKAEHGSIEECLAAHEGEDNAQEICREMMGQVDAQAAKAAEDHMAEDVLKAPADAKAEAAELKKALETTQADAKAAKELVGKMEDDRQRAVFIAKAQEFTDLPGVNPDDFGPILRKAYGVWTADEQKKVEEVLRGAVKVAQDSALFREIGSGVPATGSPEDKLNQLANNMVQKDGKLTFAQAFAKVCDTDEGKALYHQMEDEQRRQANARRVR